MNEHEVLYMGLRRINGKMAVMFCPIIGGVASLHTSTLFGKPKATLMCGLYAGWVYAMECELSDSEVKSVSFGTHNAIRKYHVGSDVDEFIVSERAAKVEEDMAKKAKEENLTKRIDELVRPLKRAIDKTNPAGRSAIIALVIQRLMK